MIVVVASIHPIRPAQGPLEGEDIETEHWEDARHWMSIYDDLIRFKLGLLERVKRELPKLHPVAQKAADVDVVYIEAQMAGYYERLDLWYQRVWKLHGLWLDPDGRILRHKGQRGGAYQSRVRAPPVPPRPSPSVLHLVTDHGVRLVRFGVVPRRSSELRLACAQDPGAP